MTRKEKIACIRTRPWLTWGDVLAIAAALLLTLACFLIAFYIPKTEGDSFSVYYREEKIFTASLEIDADYLFYIEGEKGIVIPYSENAPHEHYNRIRVSGGSVWVAEADCPDKTCIYLGKTDWGEISCLPHDLRIDVEGGGLETDV